jgi:hypothetical protein
VAVPSFGPKLTEYCESLGALEVRRLRLQNHCHSLDWRPVDAWLAVKEAEGKARAEERAEESLSIARKAFVNSRRATSIAICAIVLSIIMAIQKLIDWFSR